MCKTKVGHTPGPWDIAIINYPHRIDEVPNISLDLPGNDLVMITGTNREANAHLIAAAPDLLAACKWTAQGEHHPACISHKASTGYDANGYLKCDCYVGAARAAIAKAEGGKT